MSISVEKIDLNILNMHTRFPFKYGIASLVALPHLFVRARVNVDGAREIGLAADGLPPKWFTKNPDAPFEDDLDEMLTAIQRACEFALQTGTGDSVFDFWQQVYAAQRTWARGTAYPPLLWAFGVSLVERAVIDAFCRAKGMTFARAVQENALGIRLGDIHAELEGNAPGELLMPSARRSITVRHTVGLADPLTDADIATGDRVDDGLPQSLAANIETYRLTHLKIKLCGDAGQDLDRLRQIAGLMGDQCAFTLDGNEQYTEVEPFRKLWETLQGDARLSRFLNGLLFVEQPLHRDSALRSEVKLMDWTDRPPMIIDESDGALDSAIRALECGYVGTSHKNCKGVFKGIANACLMAHRRKCDPSGTYILSSEDLANVGPVALLQDLAALAVLGVDHAERNGHHYFAGLGMYPEAVQSQVLARHASLYRQHAQGFPVLDIRNGALNLESVIDAPFGYGFDLDTLQFTPLADWTAASLR